MRTLPGPPPAPREVGAVRGLGVLVTTGACALGPPTFPGGAVSASWVRAFTFYKGVVAQSVGGRFVRRAPKRLVGN